MEYSAQLQTMHEIACAAGQQIMQVYESDVPVEVATKDDASPLTEADRQAHQLITDALSGLPEDCQFCLKRVNRSATTKEAGGKLIGGRPARRHEGVHQSKRRIYRQHRFD